STAIPVKSSELEFSCRVEPPAERLYPLLPIGVTTMRPSPAIFWKWSVSPTRTESLATCKRMRDTTISLKPKIAVTSPFKRSISALSGRSVTGFADVRRSGKSVRLSPLASAPTEPGNRIANTAVAGLAITETKRVQRRSVAANCNHVRCVCEVVLSIAIDELRNGVLRGWLSRAGKVDFHLNPRHLH